MNSDQMKGNWKQFVGKAKEKWGRLTTDDGRSSRESGTNSLARSKSATELRAMKQNVS